MADLGSMKPRTLLRSELSSIVQNGSGGIRAGRHSCRTLQNPYQMRALCGRRIQYQSDSGTFRVVYPQLADQCRYRLSMAELVYLHERQIKPAKELLYTDNRQKLVETIYTQENIFDNILECQMEHAACRDKVTAAIMVLLKNKKIVIL